MFIVGLLTWWYGAGWKRVSQILIDKLIVSEDFFSIDLLLSSLFAPFKQISASSGIDGNLQVKLQAWFDKQFSRVVGMIIRTILIVTGTVWMLIQVVIDVCVLLLWPLIPIAPVIGLILAIGGWTP